MNPCRQCGGSVVWKLEASGWKCYQADGVTAHWDHCAKRRWDQTVSTGERFENEDCVQVGTQIVDGASGYRKSIHGTKLDRIEGRRIAGKQYRPDGCNCGLPPWDTCKPDCEHAI